MSTPTQFAPLLWDESARMSVLRAATTTIGSKLLDTSSPDIQYALEEFRAHIEQHRATAVQNRWEWTTTVPHTIGVDALISKSRAQALGLPLHKVVVNHHSVWMALLPPEVAPPTTSIVHCVAVVDQTTNTAKLTALTAGPPHPTWIPFPRPTTAPAKAATTQSRSFWRNHVLLVEADELYNTLWNAALQNIAPTAPPQEPAPAIPVSEQHAHAAVAATHPLLRTQASVVRIKKFLAQRHAKHQQDMHTQYESASAQHKAILQQDGEIIVDLIGKNGGLQIPFEQWASTPISRPKR